jgi:hypothetical protein
MTINPKYILVLLCAAFSAEGFSACPNYFRIYGSVQLSKKKWTTTKVTKTPETLCESLPSSPKANLLITFSKDNKTFSQKIYQSLDGYWDETTPDKSYSGGKSKLKEVYLNTLIPDWFKGAQFSITDLKTGKKISETKL